MSSNHKPCIVYFNPPLTSPRLYHYTSVIQNKIRPDAASKLKTISWVRTRSWFYFFSVCAFASRCVWDTPIPTLTISSTAGMGPLSKCFFNVRLPEDHWVRIDIKQAAAQRKNNTPSANGWREPGLFYLAGYAGRARSLAITLARETITEEAQKRHTVHPVHRLWTPRDNIGKHVVTIEPATTFRH